MKISGKNFPYFWGVGLWAFVEALPLLACPVCGNTDPASGRALLISTGILSILPLGMFAGIIGYLVYAKRKRDRRL